VVARPRRASNVRLLELAERMGHSKASMSLDVYTHVVPPDEAGSEWVLALLASAK
jgi:integrase